MRGFDTYNPLIVFIYFLFVLTFTMFSPSPILITISFIGAVCYLISRKALGSFSQIGFYILLFLVMTLINPIFSHNGQTVLFVMNDTPITLEALLFGAFGALSVITALLWFKALTHILTEDKLLYIFGRFSPKLSLLLSMSIRYVGLLSDEAKKIKSAATSLGLYKDGTLIDRMRGSLRIFSVLITYALENGIITADSMTARGYGTGRRTHFAIYRVTWRDIILLTASVLLFTSPIVALSLGAYDFNFYPLISYAHSSTLGNIGYSAFAALSLLPAIIEVKEGIRWKYLRSKI